MEELIMDPRKHELLEARFVANPKTQSGSESNMSAASSFSHGGGSDRDNDSIISSQDLHDRRDNRRIIKRKGYNSVSESPSKRSTHNEKISSSQPIRGTFADGLSKTFNQHQISQKQLSNKETQTDLTKQKIEKLETNCSNHLNVSSQYNETYMRNASLKTELEQTKKIALANKERVENSAIFIEKLLKDNTRKVKEEARKKAMEGRLRLGQFVRRGAGYHETWDNGWAFHKIAQRKERIAQERADIDQSRRFLKRTTTKNKSSDENRSNRASEASSKRRKVVASEELTSSESHERDEVLKQRLLAVKRDEGELQFELDRLERERSLHIRELKRIANEDNSQFNSNPVLNKRYLLLTMLGKGGFSEVYKGFDLELLRYVAVKIHHLNRDWNENKKVDYARHANRESDIHRLVNHPRIVSLYDRFEVDINTFCTVLEFCEGNDLDFYLKQHKMMSEKEARTIIMQVVSALVYLNSLDRPVIHYDLKPGNILLCNGTVCGDIKITDFGLSKRLDSDMNDDGGIELTSQGAGTYWYLPPECFLRMPGGVPPIIDNKVDVWSVGVIFYQCLFGKKPFGHNLTQEMILKQDVILNAREVVIPPKPVISSEAKSFIKACLAHSKDKRANVYQLHHHPYLQPNALKKNNTQNGSAPS